MSFILILTSFNERRYLTRSTLPDDTAELRIVKLNLLLKTPLKFSLCLKHH